MNSDTGDRSARKKNYVKPEVKRVMLRPEEAVLASCKTSSSGGPLQSTCNIPKRCSSMQS